MMKNSTNEDIEKVLDAGLLKQFGKRIAEYRREARLTQEQLSEKLGVSKNFLGTVERGLAKLSLSKAIMLSQHTGLSIDYLIFGENPDHYLALKINEALSIIRESEAEYAADLDEAVNDNADGSTDPIISRRVHPIYKKLDSCTYIQLNALESVIDSFKLYTQVVSK